MPSTPSPRSHSGELRIASYFSDILGTDIRGPLVSIGLLLEHLQRLQFESDRTTAGLVLSARESIDQTVSLTDDLISLFQDPEKSARNSLEPVSIKGLLLECFVREGGVAKAKGIGFSLEAAEGVHPVWGCRSELKKAFSNLIANALHFTQPGGTVDLKVESDFPSETVRVVIRDTGPGISEEHFQKIFEAYRHRETLIPGFRGNGLGLAITRRILREHGGQISVESRVGEGSAFEVFLPVLSATGQGADTPLDPDTHPKPASFSGLHPAA